LALLAAFAAASWASSAVCAATAFASFNCLAACRCTLREESPRASTSATPVATAASASSVAVSATLLLPLVSFLDALRVSLAIVSPPFLARQTRLGLPSVS
jgi:hypothetical protein